MTFINPTSSYIRKKGASLDATAMKGSDSIPHADAIWALLSTPQTVESLRRRIGHDAGAAPDEFAITAVLKNFVSRDLIEMSPEV